MPRQTHVSADDLRTLRTGALATAALLPVAMALAGLLAGPRGVLGAVIGVVLATVFFAVSTAVVTAAGRVSPALMFQAAMATYLVKVLALFGLFVALRDVTVFNGAAFGWSVIVATLVWLVAEVKLVMTSRVLYVDPKPEEG